VCFGASKKDSEFTLDYVVPSVRSQPLQARRIRIPIESCLYECSAVGFTCKGSEKWSFDGEKKAVHVEAVALPPYPATERPRVVGLLMLGGATTRKNPITYLQGDALQPRGAGQKVIAHLVNDRTPRWGGGGFAQAIRRRWPDVQRQFNDWVLEDNARLSLGAIHAAQAADDIRVVSMVAQHGFGPSERPRIRYPALNRCLASLAEVVRDPPASVHMPMIGTGHAGGDWRVIEELLLTSLCGSVSSVTVYTVPR
jgi:O-acetyl-ADP-ribose deacetylase (regulator of RNase III)